MQQIRFAAGFRPDRSVIRLGGPGSRQFLHNLLTADIEGLAQGEAAYAALLTPQGKILFDVFVLADDGDFLIDCAASQKAEIIKRLTFYKLRAKVTIGDLPGQAVGVTLAEPEARLRYRDPRSPEIGWRFVADAGSLPPSRDYDAARIGLGLADSAADLGSGAYFPHEANLDQLGAVSFTKGCYVGQEVISRMEHRGLARSRILPVFLHGPAPEKGAEIHSGGKAVGTLLSSAGNRALALIRLDRLADAVEPLLTGAVTVDVLKPRWARYDVAKAKDMA